MVNQVMRAMIAGFVAGVVLLGATGAEAADPGQSYLGQEVAGLRDRLGKPLLEVVTDINDKTDWVIQRLSPQGATFAFTGNRRPGEPFDDLRKRTSFSVSITTCPNSKSLDAKISSVIGWQRFAIGNNEDEDKMTSSSANYLQRLLEQVNIPASLSNPSNVRLPRNDQTRGLVFEYVKGDTTEVVSFIDEISQTPTNAQRMSWQATNTSFCPKN